MDEYTPCKKNDPIWNARKEEEKRRMIQKRREKLRRQNAELLMRVNYVLRAGLKIKEFTRCVSLDYSGQVNAIEIRELERIGESVGAAYERIEKIVNAIVDRNTERRTV